MSSRHDELEGVQQRLLLGDPTASADLFRIAQRPIAATIYRQHRAQAITWEDALDLATDSIVAHVRNPTQYDGSRSRLATYLVMVAKGDALNMATSRSNAKKNYGRLVELTVVERNDRSELDPTRMDAERIVKDHGREIIRDPGDEAVLRLFLSGEDATLEYARALGLHHLDEGQQRLLVKQRRDRIDKRLQRLGLKI
ncbi:MAG: hypothetical protein JOZ27_02865 [Caulobacteraceae bacterium]|nr:hypothetical protein [Caulobacteraceae bacterium]